MKTKAELFAYFGECLAASAIVWVGAASLVLINADARAPGVCWILLMTLAAALVYVLILKRGTIVITLAVVSLIMAAGEIAAYVKLYEGTITFSFILACILWSVTSVYTPMHLAMSKQQLVRHMTFIDVLIGALVWLMVFYSAIEPDTYSVLCIIAVTVINVASAIGLRMSEEGMNEGIGKAFALSAASLAAAAGVIYLLVKLFSRSGAVTEAVLNGIKTFFLKIGALLQRFIEWLASFATPSEEEFAPETGIQGGMGAAEIEIEEVHINPLIPGIIIGIAAAVVIILILRKTGKHRLSLTARIGSAGSAVRSRRKRGVFAGKWKSFLNNVRFRIRSVIERNTPPGVLAWLERKASGKKIPRLEGESIREFTFRLAPDGTLDPLTEDLEKRFYGGADYSLPPGKCRSIRKEMKKRFRTGG